MRIVPHTLALSARTALLELEQRDIDTEPLLDQVGLRRGDVVAEHALIPFEKNANLLEMAARAADDDLFGLLIGEQINIRDLGAIGYIGISSDNLGEAIQNFQRYLELISQTDRIKLEIVENQAIITSTPKYANLAYSRQVAEVGAAIFVRFCRSLAGDDIAPIEIRFTHNHSGDTSSHETILGCPISFGCSESQLVFRREDLSARIGTADHRLKRILQNHCENLLEKSAKDMPDFLRALQGCLLELLPKQKAKSKAAAERLGISERTLSRRLRRYGTDFKQVRDSVRRDLAYEYLRGTDENLAHIAYLLNYSSQSAFSASFKRMTGKTPSEVRRGD